MAERHTLKLSRFNRDKAHVGVTRAPDGWVLELREPKRSDDQNDAIHGLIDQIIKQRPIHNGIRMDKALWKASFMQALGEEIRFIPTLDGDGVFPIGLSTRELGKNRFSELIEFVLAWCAREGLTIKHFDDAMDGEAPNKASPKAA